MEVKPIKATVQIDAKDAIASLKALQREARKTVRELKRVEDAMSIETELNKLRRVAEEVVKFLDKPVLSSREQGLVDALIDAGYSIKN
jgi:hypothetical protein